MPDAALHRGEATRGGSGPGREPHASVTEALRAYSALVRARTAEGHAVALPPWEASRALADDAFVEEVRHEEGDRIEKRWCHRVDDPSDEFGSELWFEQGRPWRLDHQLGSRKYGPAIELRLDGPEPRAVTTTSRGGSSSGACAGATAGAGTWRASTRAASGARHPRRGGDRHGEYVECDEAGAVVGKSWWRHGEPAEAPAS